MLVNLIFNPNSGLLNNSDPDEIIQAMFNAGFDPQYTATSSESDLDAVLQKAEGLVVVAGGDGSVRAVATRMLGRNLPMAIIPLGTANNIAKALNISGTPQEIIDGLRNPIQKPFDIGSISAPWGSDYFVEAFGAGLYAEGLSIYEPEKGKSFARSLSTALQLLPNYETQEFNLWVDGKDYSGEYLLVEVLNIEAFGPRIKAVPGADISDGMFELVLVHPDQQTGLMSYLKAWANDEIGELPSVEVVTGKELMLQWKGFPVHVDAEVRPHYHKPHADHIPASGARAPGFAQPNASIVVTMIPQAIQLWLPRSVDETQVEGNPQSSKLER